MDRTKMPLTQSTNADLENLPKDLFRLWRIPFSEDLDPSKLVSALRERIKELNCLYGLSRLVEQPGISLEEILQGMVELIPPGWHYPGITCARIVLDKNEYKTDH